MLVRNRELVKGREVKQKKKKKNQLKEVKSLIFVIVTFRFKSGTRIRNGMFHYFFLQNDI